MRTIRCLLAFVIIAVTIPFESVRAQNIYISPFQGTTGQDVFLNTHNAYIRRGRASTVRIVKDFINLVSFNDVRVSGGNATISNLSNGLDNGTGYLQMSMHVPIGTAVGTDVVLTVGLGQERFTFNVVRNAIVTSFTPNPSPTTIAAGTPWTLTIQGSDLGTPTFDPNRPSCHSVQITSQNNSSLTATLQRNAGCTALQFTAALQPIAGETPSRYRLSSGSDATYGIGYAPSGVTCTSRPDIGAPVITSPLNGALLNFGASTPSPTSVSITWQANTQPGNIPAPNNEFIVTRPSTTKGGLPSTTSTTVTGTSASFSFAIPGTYTVSVRAKNCGATAPSSSVTFSTRYQ